MKRKLWIALGVIPFFIFVDQWTKLSVHRHFRWGESLSIIPSFFSITYVRNTGAAFGMFQKAPAELRDSFFILLPIVALFALGFLFTRLENSRKVAPVALTLIVAGALGNLIDRVRFGFVIDFLDFHWSEVYHWPAFNVADSCIVVGVGLMFLDSFISDLRPRNASQRPPSSLSGRGGHAKEGIPSLGRTWSQD